MLMCRENKTSNCSKNVEVTSQCTVTFWKKILRLDSFLQWEKKGYKLHDDAKLLENDIGVSLDKIDHRREIPKTSTIHTATIKISNKSTSCSPREIKVSAIIVPGYTTFPLLSRRESCETFLNWNFETDDLGTTTRGTSGVSRLYDVLREWVIIKNNVPTLPSAMSYFRATSFKRDVRGYSAAARCSQNCALFSSRPWYVRHRNGKIHQDLKIYETTVPAKSISLSLATRSPRTNLSQRKFAYVTCAKLDPGGIITGLKERTLAAGSWSLCFLFVYEGRIYANLGEII